MNMSTRCLERPTLLISPHPDDVAYSIGGLIACHAPLFPLELVTVFSRSHWADALVWRNAHPAMITRLRAREDEDFAAMFGLRLSRLDFPDASLCGYDDVREVAAMPVNDWRIVDVEKALRELIANRAPECVLAPAAIGNHVDHRIVRAALQNICGDRIRVLYYEDLPYAADLPLEALSAHFEVLGLKPCLLIDIGHAMAAKVAAMRVYASQTDENTITDIAAHARRVAGIRGGHIEMIYAERLWGNPLSLPLDYVRHVIVKTACDTTGDDADDIARTGRIDIPPRDAVEFLVRLQATFDCVFGPLRYQALSVEIDELAAQIMAALQATPDLPTS